MSEPIRLAICLALATCGLEPVEQMSNKATASLCEPPAPMLDDRYALGGCDWRTDGKPSCCIYDDTEGGWPRKRCCCHTSWRENNCRGD